MHEETHITVKPNTLEGLAARYVCSVFVEKESFV